MDSATGTRGRGRPVGADSERTRQTIVRAARDVITECGYPAATFQQIAVRAGVSRPTLHYYFQTRDQVYETLVQAVHAQITACIAHARQRSDSRGQLVAFTEEVVRLCGEDPGALRFLVTVQVEQRRGVHRSPTAESVIAAIHGFYGSLAAAVSDDGARGLADLLASVFWGIAFHAGFVARDGKGPMVARQLLNAFDDQLLTAQSGGR
ncbi:TetR/AcrR family transcriptional regulator [Mycobacterium sp. PSTR-4-N]|uniref:TetR/AcrR family transcriptional regulator n=1 Tax=Mycobacterium sp. PSTR-4-N TaxID=2917745 RepID=UPI001F14FCE5|nr:TetR/AcrR family transcriptional regulator [Mycobacterium sp. PSTR-4-N]MCG7593512.1 TetR/AcrR family transcriptional regulator [Mycobacterium sp. PSTR-4-N]